MGPQHHKPRPNREGQLTEAEAAEYIGVSLKSFRTWRVKGTGPTHTKLGGRYRYERADLDAYLAASKRTTTPAENRP